MDSKLDTFVSDDPEKLLQLTKRLFEKGFFNCYLSPQQFNLLSLILYNPVIKDAKLRLEQWKEFLNGNVSLSFISEKEALPEESTEEPNGDPVESKVNDNENINDNENKLEDENIELNLKRGLVSSRSLLSKVRYLLWEQLLDFYYSSSGENTNQYEILDIDGDEENELTSETKTESETMALNSNSSKVRGEEDDYDDEDEDEDEDGEDDKVDSKQESEPVEETNGSSEHSSLKYNDEGELVLEVSVESVTAPVEYPAVADESIDQVSLAPSLLGPSSVIESDFEKRNELKLIKNFNKIYHSFENDQKNYVKRRKLEESDKKLASINNGEDVLASDADLNDTSAANNVNKLISFGGAANLSLKNLLGMIDRSRDKLHLSDLELRNLILDVRKNRSKWASDDKIGQEELYEACERVVLELRGYTEHSTAFLNKVSKREAPNYYQVIKNPMDLNTVMKKLKSFQYKTKQEFVDDLMLIWRNCLTYNSDPSHFIRTHAIAMQKKTLSLAPLIPDITIRDRAEVEKEEAELHKDDEKEPEEDRGFKATRGGVSSTQNGSKLPKKSKKRSREEEDSQEDTPAEGSNVEKSEDTPLVSTLDDNELDTPVLKEETVKKEVIPVIAELSESQALDGTPALQGENDDEDDGDNEQQQQVGDDSNGAEDEDLEYLTWSNLTSNARFKICAKRSQLFKDNKIQPEGEALLRSVEQMSNFSHYLGDEAGIIFNSNRLEFLDRNEHDDPYLIEYDVTGGIPTLPYPGVSLEDEEKMENELVSKYLSTQNMEEVEPSPFVPNPRGLSKNYTENITLMQDIRKICFKISLIRQMQTQAFVHHTQMKPPEVESIKQVDIDPISRLENKDFYSREVCYSALRGNVSKILMSNGFESSDPFCVDVVTQVAEEYMSNLIKTIKLHTESSSVNKIAENKLTPSQIISLSLVENGVPKLDTLHTYVNECIYKQTTKLTDIRAKLSSLLKDLLRPGFLESLNEKSFNEDSEQYLTGDFASEIGDDFFGFRELGLDKEFGMISQTIPLHLLHARLHNNHLNEGQPINVARYEDIVELKYKPLEVKDIPKQIGLLQPFYESLVEKSRHFYQKQKQANADNEDSSDGKSEKEEDADKLVEDEELPSKQRNNRPRVPPTGKIPGIKKKSIETSFFLSKSEEDEQMSENATNDLLLMNNSQDSTALDTKDDFGSNGFAFSTNGAQVV